MASKGVNRAIILGNLGADPEVRYTAGGTAVTNISVATSEEWKDKSSGEKKSNTEWHRIVFFARLAEVAGEYLRKGSKVYVEGRIQTRKWQGQDGQDRYTTEIVAGELQMLDGRNNGKGGGAAKAEAQANAYGGDRSSGKSASASNYQAAKDGAGQPRSSGAGSEPGFDDDLDDDIPF